MCVFLLSGNVNAAWYRDNVSRGGGVFQHDNAPAHTALLTENVLHNNDIYVKE